MTEPPRQARSRRRLRVRARAGGPDLTRLLGTTVEHANDAVILAEAPAEPGLEARIVYVNASFERETGFARHEALGRSPRLLHGPATDAAALARLRACLEAGEPGRAELLCYRQDGSQYWADVQVRPVSREPGRVTHWVTVQRDVTERRRTEAELERRANLDELTGLPNRQMLLDRLGVGLGRARAADRRLAVAMLDLDRFKWVNDSLGHRTGDRVLRAIAGRLVRRARPGDTVARVGADEFAVLIADVASASEAADRASELLGSLAGELEVGGHELSLRASLGWSLFPDDATDAPSLLRFATAALNQAKLSRTGADGRDSLRRFTPGLARAAAERLELEGLLRGALARGELRLAYQPVVGLASGRVERFEALLRWDSPLLGSVPPERFIPVAEESGLIVPIGAWVLEEACREAAGWRRAGRPPVRVAVNVSAMQFGRGDLVAVVTEALRAAGLEPALLTVELTESLVMGDVAESAALLSRLRALGVSVAVDDFGTGYSSLSYLQRLPIDVLKIDRSFARSLADARGTRPLVEGIVALAHRLGLRVVLEGVETAAELAVARAAGVDEVQGYVVAMPLGAADAARLLDAGPARVLDLVAGPA